MYRRRLNVLECIMNSHTNIPDSQYQVNTTLKEKAVLLQKHDSKQFAKKIGIIDNTIKSKRETREIFTGSQKPFPQIPSYPSRRSERQKSFLSKDGGSNYGKFNNGSSKFCQQRQASQKRYGKYTFFKEKLQHKFSSRNKLKIGIRKYTPIDKKIVCFKQTPKCSNSSETKTFLKGLKKVNQSILDLVDDYLIPFQSKIPFQFVTSREQQKLMDKEVKEC